MSILSKVSSGIVKKPHYVLLYGEPGLGKSTFGSNAPNPIFLCTEDGTANLDVSRLRINSFDEMIQALAELEKEPHDFKTVVVDTIDIFEPMVWAEVMKENQKYSSIGAIPYNKGYDYALPFWIKFLDATEAVRARGLNVVMLAHSYVKSHNDPQLTEAYDRHQIKLHHKASSAVVARVECVLFATYKVYLEVKESGKNKAYGDGVRVMYTENRPSLVAKNRFSLPFELPLDWDEFEKACGTQSAKDPADMIKFIEEHLPQVSEPTRSKAKEHFEKNRANPVELAKIENRIKAIISTKNA